MHLSNCVTSDINGNTLTDGTRTNTWDSQNRLTSCTAGGATSTYTYGADGLRRSSTANGITTDYVYDGTMLVQEERQGQDGLLHPITTYLNGARGPECRIDETQQTEAYYTRRGRRQVGA